MRAYYFEENNLDQREPHDSGIEADLKTLEQVGVLYWKFDGPDAIKQIDDLSSQRNYKNRDQITVSPDALGAIYEEKVKTFFAEHLHEDEEIRYIVEGTGYFDVRDKSDRWIRIAMEKGDMIILPAGMYHRFTTDTKNYLKAMRLFKEDPIWTPINRPDADQNKHRLDYLTTFDIAAA